MDDDRNHELLKKIESKMTWGLIFLFCITLNTCSVADDVEDAVRNDRPARVATEAS